jgi:hemerythrin-like domain-containing protein
MNKATDNLISDHTHIEKLMDVMERITKENDPDVEHLEFIVQFIREFADGCHHAKEEGLLFPILVERGIPKEHGPIGMMLMEHDEGRNYVKGMAENIALLKSGKKEALQTVYQNMTGYVNLLRNHIAKENNVLFRIADQVLSNEEQIQLLSQFGTAEETTTGREKIEKYLNRVNELAAIYQ